MKSIFKSKKLLFLLTFFLAFVYFLSKEQNKSLTLSNLSQEATNLVTGDGLNYNASTPGYDTYTALTQGCPRKDCIPAIKHPRFETISQADQWLKDQDLVFDYSSNGHRAYPQKILNWHEVVNDQIGDVPIAITYCPLTGSALAFDRRFNGQALDLSVSGKLYNSNLVIYDQQTKSLWQQITGQAIVGSSTNSKLNQLPLNTLTYAEWKRQYPSGQILSRNTGFSRDYSIHPYGDYEQTDQLNFPVTDSPDTTIPLKTPVYGITINDQSKAYTHQALIRETEFDGVLNDTLGGHYLRISYDNGEITVEDLSSKKSQVISTRMFWFAWKLFYPQSALYQ